MAIPKILGAQRDFSSGQVNEALKRADELSAMKTGARQMVNWRVLSSGQPQNRPGRRALFLERGRVEEVLMSPGNIFYIAFGEAYLCVYNAAGAQVARTHVKGDGRVALPWRFNNTNRIVFAVVPGAVPSIYITYDHDFPLNVPLILSWDGVSQTSTWSLADYRESVLGTGQKRTIFSRLSEPNVTILPSATTGGITLQASAPVFVPGMAGCYLLWCGRQVLITGYIDPQNLYATVIEQLPNTVSLQIGQFLDIGNGNSEFIPGFTGYFLPGDLIEGAVSGARAIVTSTTQQFALAGTAQFLFYTLQTFVNAQIIPFTSQNLPPSYLLSEVGATAYFQFQEQVSGPNGNGQVGAVGLSSPTAVSVWDDEVMNNFRGWPTSCFYDQNRLGFCGFTDMPNAIAWSSNGLLTDFYVNGLATSVNAGNAIFEPSPGDQVYFVVPGMESSEFVFTSNGVYWIPITTAAPLTPGSVQFNRLSSQGCYPNIKPQQIQQSILYVRAGGASLGAVQTPGYYNRPNIVDLVSEFHSDLITASPPVALAVPQAPNQFEENYAYLLRADGVVLVTRYLIHLGLLDTGPDGKPKTGWLPWTGIGFPTWLSAQGGDLIFTTVYHVPGNPWSNGFSNGFGEDPKAGASVVEILDNSQYLDCAIMVNSAPAAFAPPTGRGPLWFLHGQQVYLYDGQRPLGIYTVNPGGYIVPQFQGGENLSSAALVAGQPWTATLEPFVPDAPAGQSVGQRMKKRRVARTSAYVSNSSGFVFARLFSGPQTASSPALGTLMNFWRIPAWNIDDDAGSAPPLREQAYRWRPSGRAFDPRVVVIKDTPGPLLIHEVGYEVTT